MNIYDISKKVGVSIATVSRVINGSANVSEKTREKVLAVIEEYGYTPNAFAKGLGLNTMKIVGVLCADSSDPYLAQAVYHIEQNLHKNNYDSLLCCTGYDLETKKSYMNLLISKRVDGIILIGSNYVEADDKNNDYIRAAAQNIPLMIINGVINAPNIYSTVCDDFNAVYDITYNFIKNGRKKLLYFSNSYSYSAIKKVKGFRAALKNNYIPIDEKCIHVIKTHGLSVMEIKNTIADIAEKSPPFNGIVTSDDIIAVGAVKYAKDAKIRIPEDLFVAGFNNFNIAECCDPELTSVDNKLELLCKHCVEMLMGVFSEKSMPKNTVFSAEIIERKTTVFKK